MSREQILKLTSLVLRRLSLQTQPKGTGASSASAPQFRDPNLLVGAATADDVGVYRIDKDRGWFKRCWTFPRPSWMTLMSMAKSLPPTRFPTSMPWAAARSPLWRCWAFHRCRSTAHDQAPFCGAARPRSKKPGVLAGSAAHPQSRANLRILGHRPGLATADDHQRRRPSQRRFFGAHQTARHRDHYGHQTRPDLDGARPKTVACRSRLNTVGADLAERGPIRAGTDVTGFGLLGHLDSPNAGPAALAQKFRPGNCRSLATRSLL